MLYTAVQLTATAWLAVLHSSSFSHLSRFSSCLRSTDIARRRGDAHHLGRGVTSIASSTRDKAETATRHGPRRPD